MTPGLSEDLQEVSDARKTAMISNELSSLRMASSPISKQDSYVRKSQGEGFLILLAGKAA